MDRPQQPIRAAAEACATKFTSLLATPAPVPARRKATVEMRRADFNLWADDVGAMSKPSISLDTRLHGRIKDIELVANVLAILGDSIDYCAEMLPLDSSDDSGGDEAFHATVLNLDAALDSLAQIGMAIRRTGKASRNRRADRTFDPSRYPEFRRHLECIILLRASSQGLSDIDASKLCDIQTRLIEANLRRRHKFVLAQKRCLMQDAASREEERAREQAAQELAAPEDDSTEAKRNLGLRPAALPQDAIRRPKSAPVPAATGKAAVAPTISHISASTAEGSLKYSKDTKYKAGIAKTNITSIATTADFPGAPRLDDGKKMGRCPCCCQALSAEILQTPTSWKKHVIEDLCPYTCVAKNCPKPDALFTSREEWETHFAESHPPRWECPFCEEEADHDSVESMRDHLDSQHADELRDNDLPDDLSWCEVQKMGITTCPLCASTGPEDAPELVDHVLHHTYDFALRALPWPRPVEHDVSAPPGTFGLADEPEKRQLIEQYVDAVVSENFIEDEQPGEPVVAQLWGYDGDCTVPDTWHPSEYSGYFDDEMNRYFYDASHEDQNDTDVAVQDRNSDADAAFDAASEVVYYSKQGLQRPLTDAEKGILKKLTFPPIDFDTPDVEPTPYSCTWFSEHEKMDEWTRQNRGILCVQGPAGSGKTTLLRHTRDTIERDFGDSSIILWYQFRREVHLKNEPVYFLRAILHQLLRQAPNAASPLRQFFLDGEPVEMGPAALQLVLSRVLSDAIRACPVFLFVDGIDECDKGDALGLAHHLFNLHEDVRSADFKLKICISARKLPAMPPMVASGIINLEEEHHMDMVRALTRPAGPEVKAYIGGEVYAGPELDSCRAHVLSRLVPMLRSDGLTRLEIHDSIRALPLSLQDVYPWILTKSKDYWRTLRLMRWLCYSTRTLKADELRWAMYTDPLSPGDSLKAFSSSAWAIRHGDMVRRIERLSCGLARLDRHDRWVLFHPTVRGVLVNDRPEELQGGPQAANGIPCELALSCLSYLAMVMEFGQSPARPEVRFELVFLDYAARSWIAHAKEVDRENCQHIVEMLREPLVNFWLRCCHEMDGTLGKLPRRANVLHIAASEGMTAPVEFMVKDWPGFRTSESINSRDSLGHTPLALAAAESHIEVVDILLEAEGVDINKTDFQGRTPLFLAVTNGHEKIAFMLLDARADASVRGPEGEPLFSLAIANGLDHLATLLLMQVTPLDPDDGYSAESLCLAAARGYENVVSELLERGVGVDVRDRHGVTALALAAAEGHTDVVDLLLQKGADLHVSNSWPLFIASTRGYVKTIEVLLKRGADPNATDAEGDTPLAMAVLNGRTDVVRMLIDAGADPNVDFTNGLTPLTEAAVCGLKSMVAVLLQCGADPDYYDQGNHTPLTRAIVSGQVDVVKMLLEAGAYASHSGPDGQTPLFLAAANGDERIVELLLDVGNVHPGQMSRHGVLPMTIARQNGHGGVVDLLESRMSDPGERARTPTSIHGEAVNYVQGDHDDEDAEE